MRRLVYQFLDRKKKVTKHYLATLRHSTARPLEYENRSIRSEFNSIQLNLIQLSCQSNQYPITDILASYIRNLALFAGFLRDFCGIFAGFLRVECNGYSAGSAPEIAAAGRRRCGTIAPFGSCG